LPRLTFPQVQGESRQLLLLILAQLTLHSAMAGQRMAAPLQALKAGQTAWAVGLLLALFTVIPALSAIATGRWVDRSGYQHPMRMAVTLTIGGALLALASTLTPDGWNYPLLCLGAAASGAGANVCGIATQRAGGLLTRDTRSRLRVFSWLAMSPAFANAVGPVVVGILIDSAGFRSAYGALLALPLLTLWIARKLPKLASRESAGVTQNRGDIRSLLAVPGLRRLLFVNWLLSASWDVHSFAVPVLGFARNYSASTIGMVLGVFTLAVTLVRFIVPLLSHRINQSWLLWAAMVLTGAVFAAYPFAATPVLMGTCAALLGLTLGAVQPTVVSALYQLSPAGREGEAIALRSMAISGSNTLMPLAFGAAGSVVGPSAVFWIMGTAVALGSWAALGLRHAIHTKSP
jgi:MFS family permease